MPVPACGPDPGWTAMMTSARVCSLCSCAARSPEQVSGHLRQEADLMLFRRHSQAVLALHERHTRLLIAVRLPGKGADHIACAMTQVLSAFPPAMRRSVTFDNGTEFARRHRLHDLGVRTFFCDTYSPWQKGGVENATGMTGGAKGRWVSPDRVCRGFCLLRLRGPGRSSP